MLVPVSVTPDSIQELRKQYDQSAFAGFSDAADPTYDDTYALAGLGEMSKAVREGVWQGAIRAALMAYDIKPTTPTEQPYTTASRIANRFISLVQKDWGAEVRPEKILADPRFGVAVSMEAPGSRLRGGYAPQPEGGEGLLSGNTKWIVLGLAAAAAAGWYFMKKREGGV